MTTDAAPPTSVPAVCVVVPVRDRRDLLAGLLAALDIQTFRDFEVVVVDDGSSDGADSLAAAAVVAGRPVQLHRSGGTGAVEARWIGVRASTSPVLAFTDSDCVPEPEWLERGLAALDAGAGMVNGRTRPARPLNPLERSVGSGLEGLYPTCNLFLRREVFETVGGFDRGASRTLGFRHNERARGTGFGEDTLMAWRVRRSGVPTTYAADAVVVHHVFPPDLTEWLSRCWQMAAFPALVREVPELRNSLLRGRILLGDRSRVPFYAFAAALVLSPRRLAPVAFAAWAARRVADMRPMPAAWPDKLPLVPAEMLIDAVAGSAMVVGSVKAGSLAL